MIYIIRLQVNQQIKIDIKIKIRIKKIILQDVILNKLLKIYILFILIIN